MTFQKWFLLPEVEFFLIIQINPCFSRLPMERFDQFSTTKDRGGLRCSDYQYNPTAFYGRCTHFVFDQ